MRVEKVVLDGMGKDRERTGRRTGLLFDILAGQGLYIGIDPPRKGIFDVGFLGYDTVFVGNSRALRWCFFKYP
jgi:hypothetical protein